MQKESIAIFGLPAGCFKAPQRRVWLVCGFAALLLLVTAVAMEGETDVVDTPAASSSQQDPNDPRETGPGQAAPWSVEGSPNPPPRREWSDRVRDRDRDGFWNRKEKADKKAEGKLRCQILEIEESEEIYVQDISGLNSFWVQLSPEVKIRAASPKSFGGRKKLTFEDLEIGQRLLVDLRRSDDQATKVVVWPVKSKEG